VIAVSKMTKLVTSRALYLQEKGMTGKIISL